MLAKLPFSILIILHQHEHIHNHTHTTPNQTHFDRWKICIPFFLPIRIDYDSSLILLLCCGSMHSSLPLGSIRWSVISLWFIEFFFVFVFVATPTSSVNPINPTCTPNICGFWNDENRYFAAPDASATHKLYVCAFLSSGLNVKYPQYSRKEKTGKKVSPCTLNIPPMDLCKFVWKSMLRQKQMMC